MGGLNVGGGHGGKKSLDAEIPLVPFIDLLLCCIMFLLVTAVWNQLARLNASQQSPGQSSAPQDPNTPPPMKLILKVTASGYTLASTGGESTDIPKSGTNYDLEALHTKLRERKEMEPNRRDIIVAAEDGVQYEHIVAAMDAVVGEGFQDMNLSDGAGL
jgi:biopolymer transport protein ExbD